MAVKLNDNLFLPFLLFLKFKCKISKNGCISYYLDIRKTWKGYNNNSNNNDEMIEVNKRFSCSLPLPKFLKYNY